MYSYEMQFSNITIRLLNMRSFKFDAECEKAFHFLRITDVLYKDTIESNEVCEIVFLFY